MAMSTRTILMRSLLALGLILAVSSAPACSKTESKNEIRVAAASSLAKAFKSVADEFTKETGTKVSLVLSSSGTITQQIKEGAPYDVFASANLDFLDQLEAAKSVDGAEKAIYAEGRVVMWVKSGSPPQELAELTSDAYEHISVANPDHAPYGMAARDAMTSAGVWSTVKGKVVRGTNVRQAMQFVESGNAEVGFIALSLALNGSGSYTEVDPSQHKPLQQGIAVVSSSKKKEQARAFIKFLTSDKGAALLKPYGLEAPK
jgi:molybdate transport system substrate-binding protein